MSIQFSGLASGLPVDNIVTQLIAIERRPIDVLKRRKDTVNLRQASMDNVSSRVNTLLTSLKKLTDVSTINLASLNPDLFLSGQATSSDKDRVTATATSAASPQTVSVEVTRLATATRAVSSGNIGQTPSGTTLLSQFAQGRITNGEFTIFANGEAKKIEVATAETLNDLLNKIQNAAPGIITGAGLTADGKLSIDFVDGANVQLGANSDTSNFLDLSFLKTAQRTSTNLTGSGTLTTLNLTAAVDSADARLGTTVAANSSFSIGKATFSANGKSLLTLVNEINQSSDAGVTASFNATTNRLELTSKTSGNTLIALKDNSGNFLAATGLVSGTDTTASQTAGQNAAFRLNGGAEIQSASNTVSDAVTGLAGVTLNLAKAETGVSTTITISRNNDTLKTAIRDVVTQLNSVISFIDEQTKSDSSTAQLKGNSRLISFRNQLRQTVSAAVSGQPSGFTSAANAGLSTGGVTTTTTGQASATFLFNESTFDAALASNPDAVRNLFIGASGVFRQVQTVADAALRDDPGDIGDGLFAAAKTANSNQIKALDTSITAAEARLGRRETQLRNQFRQMEQLISQLQSQQSSIAGLQNNLLPR
jgi:flagellar hook-associated protein 2